MSSVKILGREPAAWLTLVAVCVKLVAAFGLDVSTDQQAAINAIAAAAMGVLIAAIANDAIGAALVSLAQAALALAIGFGLDWSADRQAIVMSAVTVVVGMWDRTQVTAPVPAAVVRSVKA